MLNKAIRMRSAGQKNESQSTLNAVFFVLRTKTKIDKFKSGRNNKILRLQEPNNFTINFIRTNLKIF